MKVLVDGMPNSFGGIGSLITNIVKCSDIMSDDIKFIFLVNEDSVYKKHYVNSRHEVKIVPKFSNIVLYYRQISEILSEVRPNIVWINNTSKVNTLLPKLAKNKFGAKIVTHSHGVDCEEKRLKGVIFRMFNCINKKTYFKLIDMAFACSEASAEYFYKGYEKKDDVHIIKNGIEVNRFAFSNDVRIKVRNELGISSEDKAICTCGRLTSVKNYSFLIKVMSVMPRNYKLFLIGDGPDGEELKTLVNELDITENVTFMGFRSDVSTILNGMDFYAMPSLNEGMPFALIEAQANGLPCIVSDTITREVSLTENVYFASIQSIEEWKNSFKKVKFDFDRTNQAEIIKKCGYDIVENYEILKSFFIDLQQDQLRKEEDTN